MNKKSTLTLLLLFFIQACGDNHSKADENEKNHKSSSTLSNAKNTTNTVPPTVIKCDPQTDPSCENPGTAPIGGPDNPCPTKFDEKAAALTSQTNLCTKRTIKLMLNAGSK